jgi:hypothetical protein
LAEIEKSELSDEILLYQCPRKRRKVIVDSDDEEDKSNVKTKLTKCGLTEYNENTLDMYADLDVAKSGWYELFKYFGGKDYTKN